MNENYPDFATLFAVPPRPATRDDATWISVPILSPRIAAAMWIYADDLSDDFDIPENDPDELDWAATQLPTTVQHLATFEFIARLRQSFCDIRDRIGRGQVSEVELARCTGDEWAVQHILVTADAYGDIAPMLEDRGGAALALKDLPATWLDELHPTFIGLADLLLQDSDVLMLDELAGHLGDEELASLGIANLEPSQWFLPFANVEDPDA